MSSRGCLDKEKMTITKRGNETKKRDPTYTTLYSNEWCCKYNKKQKNTKILSFINPIAQLSYLRWIVCIKHAKKRLMQGILSFPILVFLPWKLRKEGFVWIEVREEEKGKQSKTPNEEDEKGLSEERREALKQYGSVHRG